MLVVIFGAGASNDARPIGYRDDVRPPLTYRLVSSEFDYHWARSYPGAADLIHRVRERVAAGSALEAALQEYVDDAARYPVVLSHMMAFRYYVQALFRDLTLRFGSDLDDGTTAYLTLVSKLERWRRDNNTQILYISFNYDTLLEQGLTSYLTRPFESAAMYLQQDRAVIKVHGSDNWGQEVRRGDGIELTGTGPNTIIEAAEDGLEPLPGFHVLASISQVLMPNGVYVAPAIAIPIAAKDDTSWACPADHLERMRQDLSKAWSVLAIGWKGQEPHFVRELKDRLPEYTPITVVTRPAPEGEPIESTGRQVELPWLADRTDLLMRCRVLRTGFLGFAEGERLDEFLIGVPVRPGCVGP